MPYALSKWGFGELNDNFASFRSLLSPNLTFLFSNIINLNIQLEIVTINDIPVYIYSPSSSSNNTQESIIIYIHGGGSTSLHTTLYDPTLRFLTHKANMRVFSIEYNKSPEVLFPQPQEDCFSVVRYIFEHSQEFNVDKRKIIIGGDSFGGHASLYIAFKWKELGLSRNLAPISSLFLNNPWVQFLRPDTPVDNRGLMANNSLELISIFISLHLTGKLDLVPYISNSTVQMLSSNFTTARALYPELVQYKLWAPPDYLYENYSKYADIVLNPYGSFLFQENFSDLPPTVILIAEYDKFLHENLLLYKRLQEAGVPVIQKTFSKFPHAFTYAVTSNHILPSTNEAWSMVVSHMYKYI